MTSGDFEQFYFEIHGRRPFPWQTRLAKVAAESGWPKRIALPTSSGKTSIIDVAVFLLGLQFDLPAASRSASLRTFFVIDRRVVVDEAALHARKLAEGLLDAGESGGTKRVAAEVSSRLRRFGGTVPLKVSVLRGGTYRDDTWIEMPNQPLVCVSTVDQIGSRLLFRGYGLSERQMPVHAGLVGSDTLVIVDEAHLSNPFLGTLSAIARHQEQAQSGLPGLGFVAMSATVRTAPANGEKPFGLQVDDLQTEELARRLEAPKIAELREPADFEAAAAVAAIELREQAPVVAVVVNRVQSARTIFDSLRQSGEAVLLTGRVRAYDRDQLIKRYGSALAASDQKRVRDPLFVVATQTVEVGANFDFDSLVTEAAPLDAMRQRFGRLNRLGARDRVSRAVILLRKTLKGSNDPVYGEALSRTYDWLKEQATRSRGQLLVDFGVLAMDRLIAEAGVDGLASTSTSAPLMFPAHLTAWSQTSPRPRPDPDVAPFLHGPDCLDATDVQVVWRADLNAENRQHWPEIVAMAPPVVPEALPLPVWTVRRWLQLGDRVATADVADVEGVVIGAKESNGQRFRPFLSWRGPDDSKVVEDGSGIAPGATLVIPASDGGLDENGCWAPDSTVPVRDIGDACSNALAALGTRRQRLRLHPEVLFEGAGDGNQERKERLRELLGTLKNTEDPDARQDAREAVLAYVQEQSPEAKFVQEVLAEAATLSWDTYPGVEGVAVVLTARRLKGAPRSAAIEERGAETTDEGYAASFTRVTSLSCHTAGVKRWAGDFAGRCGLSRQLAEDIELAAELHDLGKLDERFQAMLCGGIIRGDAIAEPRAKSEFATYEEYRRAKRRSGYPDGGRHEFVSVALVKTSSVLARAHDPELVIHLVGTHHGFGRPFPPVVYDDEPVEVEATVDGRTVRVSSDHHLYQLDSGWADQFCDLLQRYGHWGLAYLEAILRRADCVQSGIEEGR